MSEASDLPPAQLKYQHWLQSKQVHVASDLVTTTNDTNLVVAGWGCVAKSDIEEGTVLFSIPREACFGASAETETEDDEVDDPTTRDTQMDMAVSILQQKYRQHLNDSNHNTDESNKEEKEEDWSPFLNLLTPPPSGLPWMWAPEFRKAMLQGTELEYVVENKVKRICREYEDVVAQKERYGLPEITYQEYVDACAIVASHTNPWFGVSIVPFNTTLNWDKVPNVEFDIEILEEEKEDKHHPDNNNNSETSCQRIVGRATRNIKKGEELTQAYTASVADLVYRCGFAPSTLEDCDGMDEDVVSIDVTDILSIVQESKKGKKTHSINSERLNLKTRRQMGSEEGDSQFASKTNISQLSSKLDALKLSGALDEPAWDGLDGLTAEIARPAQPVLEWLRASSRAKNCPKRGRENKKSPKNMEDEPAYDDGGLSKLVGIFVVLLADDAAWERASNALQKLDNDHEENGSFDGCEDEDDECSYASVESRKDDITASILLSAIFDLTPKEKESLLQVALHAGAGENDPWRALLDEITNCDVGSDQKSKKRKILQEKEQEHGQEDENEKDAHNNNTNTTSTSSISSRRAQLRAASEAAMSALLILRATIIEGELSCKNILARLEAGVTNESVGLNDSFPSADREYEQNKGSLDFNTAAKETVEACKIINILRGKEKLILDEAIDVLEMSSVE